METFDGGLKLRVHKRNHNRFSPPVVESDCETNKTRKGVRRDAGEQSGGSNSGLGGRKTLCWIGRSYIRSPLNDRGVSSFLPCVCRCQCSFFHGVILHSLQSVAVTGMEQRVTMIAKCENGHTNY